MFALEQHLTYRREVLVGDEVAVHLRLLARSEKLVHLVSYLVNHTRQEVAASMEALEAYVAYDTRRAAPFSPGRPAGPRRLDRAADRAARARAVRLDLPRSLSRRPYDERVTAREAGFGSVLLGPAEQNTGRLRLRVQTLLTILLVTTNVVGAAVVFVLSTFVIPGPAAEPRDDPGAGHRRAVYVVVAVVVGASLGTTISLRALRWATQDKAPSARGAADRAPGAVVPDPDPGLPLVQRHRAVHPARRVPAARRAR